MSNYQVPEGYKQTEVGVIPEDWEVVPFVELLDFQNGVNADKEAYGKGIPFINVLEVITKTHLRISDIPGRVFLSRKVIETYAVYKGDILFNRTSETQEEVGLSSVYLGDRSVVFGGFVIRGRNRGKRIDPVYSGYAFRSPSIRSQIIARGQGAVRANIGQRDLYKVLAVLPQVEEQCAIATALSDVDALIAALDKLIVKKRHLKTAMMQQLLTGKKRLPGFGEGKGYKQTEVGIIPEDWEIFTIGETVTLINGRAFKPSDWRTSGLPIIRIQNLNDLTATYNYYDREVEERYYVNFGDILFAWSGTKESSFGARMWRGQKAILNQHIFRVVPDEEKLTSEYVLLALKRFQEDIERKSHGFKSSFVHVKKSDLENTYLAIPSILEQRAISTVFSDMDAEISTLEARRAKTQAIKQGMMQELLTGRTRLV